MINTTNINKMLSLEVAADGWFSKLSKKEQEAYKKAHPRSKYAKSGGGSGPSLTKATHSVLGAHGNKEANYSNSPSWQGAHSFAFHDDDNWTDHQKLIGTKLKKLGYVRKRNVDGEHLYRHPSGHKVLVGNEGALHMPG